ncbi:hypothetical protein [Micromonospora sp. URMC 103]|uniref:hypothetical protein n=1 Tax=Micromonospora sp. URMC 103 TaxID=3423406 RepID=UPI003F1D8246
MRRTTNARRRLAWWLLPVVVGGALWAGAPAFSEAGDDPTLEPIPDFAADAAADEAKSIVVRVSFDGRANATVTDVEVVDERAPSHLGAPPLSKVDVLGESGGVIDTFHDWHPMWELGEKAGGGETRRLNPRASGRWIAPFDRDAATVVVTDIAAEDEIVRADLTEAIHDFCLANPDDEDCLRADLAVEAVTVTDAPPIGLVGQTATISVATVVTNNGPDGPADAGLTTTAVAGPGLTVTPATQTATLPGVAVGADVTDTRQWTVRCDAPGLRTVTVTSTVATVHAADVDLVAGNNTRSTTHTVDCAVPVTVNVKPGGDPNSINLGAGGNNTPLAVLTTAAGEYGNPLAFDARTVVAPTARFGARAVVLGGGGGAETHGRRHDERSYELDERTRDADLDAVLHFRAADGGFTAGDTEGCLIGKFTTAAGTFTFFGCGPVRIVP